MRVRESESVGGGDHQSRVSYSTDSKQDPGRGDDHPQALSGQVLSTVLSGESSTEVRVLGQGPGGGSGPARGSAGLVCVESHVKGTLH